MDSIQTYICSAIWSSRESKSRDNSFGVTVFLLALRADTMLAKPLMFLTDANNNTKNNRCQIYFQHH